VGIFAKNKLKYPKMPKKYQKSIFGLMKILANGEILQGSC